MRSTGRGETVGSETLGASVSGGTTEPRAICTKLLSLDAKLFKFPGALRASVPVSVNPVCRMMPVTFQFRMPELPFAISKLPSGCPSSITLLRATAVGV